MIITASTSTMKRKISSSKVDNEKSKTDVIKDIIKLTSSKPVEKPKKNIPPAIEPDNEKKYLSSSKPNTLTSNEKKWRAYQNQSTFKE